MAYTCEQHVANEGGVSTCGKPAEKQFQSKYRCDACDVAARKRQADFDARQAKA